MISIENTLLITDPDILDYIVWVHFVYYYTSN